MKQVVRRGLKDIVVDEVPDPMPAPHHVLVRPLYSLISSGTETASIHKEGVLRQVADNPSHLRKIWGVMKTTGPVNTAAEVLAKFDEYAALGYSGAGIVVDKHAGVDSVQIGDRVAYGGEGTGHGETILAGRHLVAKVPDAVSLEHACFTTLGSIAMNAIRISRLGLGDTVVVLGLGLVGQLLSQLARVQGARVIAIDLKCDRVDLALACGAPHGVTAGAEAVDGVGELTGGRGADCVIVAAAAKSSTPCTQALQMCRDRGRIVVVGAVEMSFPWHDMYMKEVQLLMSRAYGPGSYDASYEKGGQDYPFPYVRWTEHRNMEEFLRIAASGDVRLEPLITHRFPLADAESAYATILDPASGSLAVLLRYPAADANIDAVQGFQPRRRVATTVFRRSTNDRLKVALVGAGNIAKWAHLPQLARSRSAALHAVQSAQGVRGKSYARRFGAAYCTTDYDEILRDPEVDIVLITSRNQHHAPQALAALRAGKHVFVEKPMALTEAECRELVSAVSETRRVLSVGFNRRFAPYYVGLKKQLARRAGPAVLDCRVNSTGIAGSYWMADPAIGGAILGEACHFVDLMHWLLDAEPVRVAGFCLPVGRAEPIGQNNVAGIFEFSDGSVANLTYSTVGIREAAGERVEAFASGIRASTENFMRLATHAGLRPQRRRLFPEKGYGAQLEAFLASVRNGTEPPVSVIDGARATLGCLRLLDACRTKATQGIDLKDVLQ
jgi:predicted dehydrogenase/threonine dehydrogenase-like Zn-dependent dehydrogenase